MPKKKDILLILKLTKQQYPLTKIPEGILTNL